MVFSTLMPPAIWVLNGAANSLLRMFGIQPVSELQHVHSPEELRLLVCSRARTARSTRRTRRCWPACSTSTRRRLATSCDRAPRSSRFPSISPRTRCGKSCRAERYSRYPVYRDSLDDVIGVFLAKDLWLHDGPKPFVLLEHVRPTAVRAGQPPRRARARRPASHARAHGRGARRVRRDRRHRHHGGPHRGGRSATSTTSTTSHRDRRSNPTACSSWRERCRSWTCGPTISLRIPEGDWTTLGGYVFGELGRLPKMGDRVPFPGGELEVVAMDGRRVAAVRVHLAGAKGQRERAPVAATTQAPSSPPTEEPARKRLSDREVPL